MLKTLKTEIQVHTVWHGWVKILRYILGKWKDRSDSIRLTWSETLLALYIDGHFGSI